MIRRLALVFRWSASFVRVLCVLSVAVASIVHVICDFSSNSEGMGAGQIVVAGALDNGGSDGGQLVEACHSCSVAPYFTAAPILSVDQASSAVPEGRLVQIASAAPRIVGPPPKS